MKKKRFEGLSERIRREAEEEGVKEARAYIQHANQLRSARILSANGAGAKWDSSNIEAKDDPAGLVGDYEEPIDLEFYEMIAQFEEMERKEKREIAIMDGKIPYDATDKEISAVKNRRPTGAAKHVEPRSIISLPFQPAWKRKLRP